MRSPCSRRVTQCDRPYHLKCLDPPLEAVPEGEWFCPDCDRSAAQAALSASAANAKTKAGAKAEKTKTKTKAQAKGKVEGEEQKKPRGAAGARKASATVEATVPETRSGRVGRGGKRKSSPEGRTAGASKRRSLSVRLFLTICSCRSIKAQKIVCPSLFRLFYYLFVTSFAMPPELPRLRPLFLYIILVYMYHK